MTDEIEVDLLGQPTVFVFVVRACREAVRNGNAAGDGKSFPHQGLPLRLLETEGLPLYDPVRDTLPPSTLGGRIHDR